jgi:hypothetical protein
MSYVEALIAKWEQIVHEDDIEMQRYGPHTAGYLEHASHQQATLQHIESLEKAIMLDKLTLRGVAKAVRKWTGSKTGILFIRIGRFYTDWKEEQCHKSL